MGCSHNTRQPNPKDEKKKSVNQSSAIMPIQSKVLQISNKLTLNTQSSKEEIASPKIVKKVTEDVNKKKEVKSSSMFETNYASPIFDPYRSREIVAP